jgi:exo-beta-1,3-glucanase (GH17 family)
MFPRSRLVRTFVVGLLGLTGCSAPDGQPSSGGGEDGGIGAESDATLPPGKKPDAGGGDATKPAKDASSPSDAESLDAGSSDAASDSPTVTGDGGPRAISPSVLARKAICYSGYRANEDPTASPPTYPTEAEVTSDLKLLVQGGWGLLRLFDCGPHATVTLKAIRDNNLDFKVMQGVSIAGPVATSDAANQAEIQRCLALNTQYADIIVAFSVGNETLDAWSNILTPPNDLAGYMTEVRGQVAQPVTTDDFAPVFSFGSDTLPDGGPYSYAGAISVVRAADFLSLHVYPFLDAPYSSWDYQQMAVPQGPARAVAMMAAAEAYTESTVMSVRQALAGKGLDVPILIGESGWKSKPTPNCVEVSLAHPVNEQMFYDAEMAWVYGAKKDANSPLAAFYFASFDEPWKTTDDNWGLFDTNRYAKYALWSQFPSLKAPGSPNYTQADAVYYKAGDPTNPPP